MTYATHGNILAGLDSDTYCVIHIVCSLNYRSVAYRNYNYYARAMHCLRLSNVFITVLVCKNYITGKVRYDTLPFLTGTALAII